MKGTYTENAVGTLKRAHKRISFSCSVAIYSRVHCGVGDTQREGARREERTWNNSIERVGIRTWLLLLKKRLLGR